MHCVTPLPFSSKFFIVRQLFTFMITAALFALANTITDNIVIGRDNRITINGEGVAPSSLP